LPLSIYVRMYCAAYFSLFSGFFFQCANCIAGCGSLFLKNRARSLEREINREKGCFYGRPLDLLFPPSLSLSLSLSPSSHVLTRFHKDPPHQSRFRNFVSRREFRKEKSRMNANYVQFVRCIFTSFPEVEGTKERARERERERRESLKAKRF